MSNKSILLFLILLLYLASGLLPAPVYANIWYEIEEEMARKLEVNPHDPHLHFQIGVSYAKTGRIEKAYERFDILKEMADAIDLEESISVYMQKIDEGEDYLVNLSYLAFAYYVIKAYEESREALEELVLLEPHTIWNFNYLALVYRDLKLFDKAEKTLLESLEIEKNNYTRFILGLVYYEQGRYIKALIEFGRSRDVARAILDLQ